jgi:hypothetical protein
MEQQLLRLPGVINVTASSITRNILFLYDCRQVNEQGLLDQLRGHSSYFPAQADLLVPDLRGLADLLETAARRDQAVVDAVALSGLVNAVGAGLLFFPPPRLRPSPARPVYSHPAATTW